MHELMYSRKEDLRKISICHRSAFPESLSSKLGISYISKMLEWYLSDNKRFLFHIENNGKCSGYCGGMIIDGTQPLGSSSGMLQHSFNKAIASFILRPWVIFHPELRNKYGLVIKNMKARFKKNKNNIADKRIESSHENRIETVIETGLVVIGVAKEFRGKGIGSSLLTEFENKTRSLNIKKMGLAVKCKNEQALKSYQRNGWVISSQKDDYYEMIKLL